MFRGSVNPADLQKWSVKHTTVMQAIRLKMNTLLLELQAKIVGEKLEGQVLQHRSGLTQRAVILDPSSGATLDGDVVSGSVILATSPQVGGQFHEFGGTRAYEIVPVNKKVLMWIAEGGAKRFAKRVMHPPIKERSFMRSSLTDMHDRIVTELRETAVQALRS